MSDKSLSDMHKYLDAVNNICYTYLGFEISIFVGFGDDSYCERFFADMFSPNNNELKRNGIVVNLFNHFMRWWHNRWKHQIVYSDSLLSTFSYQVHAHLMKPATLMNR